MTTRKSVVFVLVLAVLLLTVSTLAGRGEEITKTFDKKERVRLKTISGDCVVEKSISGKIEVTVISRYSPSDAFEPRFKDRGSSLKITEELHGNTSGSSTWILRVPEGTEIEFSMASGGMTISDMKGEFSANTASGDFEIENCHGEFEVSTASGGVKSYDIVLDEESSFSSASGSVRVKLAESAEYDLDVSSASGDALLNYGGNPVKGRFEFTVRKRRGKIVSPYDFDEEEEFYRWDNEYVRKSFTKGEDTPLITISSASGKATLKKK